MIRWYSENDYHFYLDGSPLTSEAQIEKHLADEFEKGMYIYDSDINMIIETNKNEKIGIVNFKCINWKNKNLNINIYIGSENHQNKMYGADALLAGLWFAFNELNMHKVVGYIYEFNERSFRISERGNAKRELTLRKHVFKDGKYYDAFVYGILRSEFDELMIEAEKTLFRRNSKKIE